MPWFTGYDREKIPWYPAINPSKCVSCGMCMNCGRNVYEWKGGKAVVTRPYDCVVGCHTCANLCLGNAITFPPIEPVREIYRREKIWSKVKRELKDKGILPGIVAPDAGE